MPPRKKPAGFSERPQSPYEGEPFDLDALLPDVSGKRRKRQFLKSGNASRVADAPADLPAEGTGVVPLRGKGAVATLDSLKRLLEGGRPEFAGNVWTPHRPPQPEKTEGGRITRLARCTPSARP